MPRIFSTAIQGEIDKQFGGEPMVLVEISWSGTGFTAYTDRKLNGLDYPYPLIHSIGQFDTTTIVSGGSDSQSVNLVLNDADGSLRNTIDNNDIHLRPIRVYLTFQGLPLTDKALMFEGVLNSPYTWNESDRTLSFSVFSKVEDSEAGFTMEDGDFPFVPPGEANKPWPLVFGQVCNMEAVRVTALRKGFLAQGIGVPDPTLDERLCQANYLQCALVTTNVKKQLTEEQQLQRTTIINRFKNSSAMIQLSFSDIDAYDAALEQFTQELDQQYNVRNTQEDQQCLDRRFNEICKILQEKEQQEQYVLNPFTVRNGEDFPQGERITIKIGEVRYTGIMTGESFFVISTDHPANATIDNPPCKQIQDAGLGWRYQGGDDLPTDVATCAQGGGTFGEDVRNGSGESWRYYNEFEAGNFIWLPAGTDVFLAEESEIINIVSLLPGTVDQVAAYRTYGDTSLLTEVDPALYTVYTTDYSGYDVVEVWLDSPLSTIDDEDWDDELFVSFTSSIGPNPADIIQWLVEKYTDYTVDTTTFASVKSSLTNYPSNFFVKSRPSVLQLIRDIAYQARCAIYIRDDVMYITYLTTEPTSLRTLTESDILTETFSFSHTETEDLETRHQISWKEGEAGVNKNDPTDFDFVLKNNIPKYGMFNKEYDYFTQNTFDTIQKSATYWMIQKSNTWRIVEFETPITQLNLDVFDCVTLDINQFPTTKIVIQEAAYNVDTNTIKFKAWTPILSGTNTPYFWAWPSQQAAVSIHPLDGAEGQSGDGYDFEVIPPIGHPLRGGYDPDTAVLATDGDKHPSDLDDTFPTLVCDLATGAEIADDVEPIIRIVEPLANKNFEDKLDGIEASGLNSGGGAGTNDDKESKNACGDPGPANGGCVYEVTITYVTPLDVTTVTAPGEPCPTGGPCLAVSGGRPCQSGLHTFCHSFGALFAATAFQSAKKAEAQALWDNCGYASLQTDVYAAGGITGIEGSGAFGECEDVNTPPGDENAPGADAGETLAPGLKNGDPDTAPSLD